MKKLSVMAFFAVCFISVFTFTGCELLLGGGSSSGTPSITITTDAKFTLDESSTDGKHYNLTLLAGESYTINYSLGDYEGEEYYVELALLQDDYADTITIDASTGVITAQNVDSTKYASFTIKLKKQNKSSAVKTFWVFVTVKKDGSSGGNLESDVSVSFRKTDMNYDKHGVYEWFFNLNVGETFRIKPVVSGIENYTLQYVIRDAGIDQYISVANSGDVTALQATSEYVIIQVKVYNSNGGCVKTQNVRCIIGGTDAGCDIDYKDVHLILNANSDDVTITKNSDTSYYVYELTAGFENVEYLLPQISFTGLTTTTSISIEFVADNSYLSFVVKEDNATYFTTTKSSKYLNGFNIIAKVAGTEKVIDKLHCTITLNGVGRGSYSIYDYEKATSYTSDTNITIFQNKTMHVRPIFSTRELLNKVDNVITAEEGFSYQVIEGNSIITDLQQLSIKSYISIFADKAGASTLVLNYNTTDSAGTPQNYSITLTITVITPSVEEIYVPNPEYITIDSTNNVSLNGKLIALYNDGSTLCVNGHGYSCEVANLSGTNKQVTISYSGKSVSYTVDTASVPEYSKTTLSTDYYDYWENNIRGCTPSAGDVKVLVVPIWFTNSNTFISEELVDHHGVNQKQQVLEDLNSMLFADKVSNGWCSLRQYYLEESFGALNITGTVTDWISVDHPSTYYVRSNENSKSLVSEVVNAYFANSTDNPANYDSNNDNFIDAVMIYYGAPYLSTPTSEDDYRQFGRGVVYKSSASTTITSTSYKFGYYSYINFADIYNMPKTAEVIDKLHSFSDLSSYNSSALSAETSIHEFGHLLGLYDLYDTVLDSQTFPAGQATMQDYDMCGHDPYSVLALGWANPYVFDASEMASGEYTITIKDFQSSGDLILLTPNWNDTDSPFDEYILIELYTPTGLNEYDANRISHTPYAISTAGVRVWHVNATLSGNHHLYNNDSVQGASDNLTKHLVHYIRNDENSYYGKGASRISDSTMYHEGDTFDLYTYRSQFRETASLDSGNALNWSFTISEITTDEHGNASVTITLTRA